MVEQEHTKNSAVFPESLISSKTSPRQTSNEWLMNNATSLIKSEELCSSDFLNTELLYGSVLSSDETFCCSLSNGSGKGKNTAVFQDALPNNIFSVNDSTPCDLYYNDKSLSYAKDFWSPMSEKISSDSYFEANSPLSFWGSCPLDLETIKMEEVFQVDKDDLVQSPTLAELNANDESLFDSFDNFEVSLPSELKPPKSAILTPAFNSNSVYKIPLLSEDSQVKPSSETSSDRTNLLLTVESCGKGDSFPKNDERSGFNPKEDKTTLQSSNTFAKSSETAKINSHLVNKHVKKMHSSKESTETTENSDKKSCENASELSSPVKIETIDSEDDSEMDCDYSSDMDEESEEETKGHSSKQVTSNNLLLQKKKSRYFWQYNIQSKGPKAPKVKLDGKSVDKDEFSRISDPVFSSSYMVKGKPTGKARRGDGNDLTPNPQKLYNIGLELEKLTSVIEGLIPANELPVNARIKSRKEKNKLASRACRLKKKAQHEANKLKLFGLQTEQKHLLAVINEVVKVIRKGIDNVKHGKTQSNIFAKVEAIRNKKCYTEVAGCSAEFVNNVLKNVDSGNKTGGLDIEIRDE